MRNVDGTASPLAFFGAELRRIRNEAGLSQEQLGQRIGYSGTLIGKVEIGERAPSEDLAGRCDAALDTKGLLPRIYDLARRWDGGYPSWFAEWVESERRATMLRTWEPLLIPGLLQTPDYARTLFLAWHGADTGRPGRQHSTHPVVGFDGDDLPDPALQRPGEKPGASADVDRHVAVRGNQPVECLIRRAWAHPVIIGRHLAEGSCPSLTSSHAGTLTRIRFGYRRGRAQRPWPGLDRA